jgi:hypothetical protein
MFEFFQDGWEEDEPRRKNLQVYLTQLELAGKNALRQLIKKHAADKDHPVSCLINNSFIPWVCDMLNNKLNFKFLVESFHFIFSYVTKCLFISYSHMLLSELKRLCLLVFQELFYIGVTWELFEM